MRLNTYHFSFSTFNTKVDLISPTLKNVIATINTSTKAPKIAQLIKLILNAVDMAKVIIAVAVNMMKNPFLSSHHQYNFIAFPLFFKMRKIEDTNNVNNKNAPLTTTEVTFTVNR